MTESLLQQGMDLMLFGMGTVFVFLTVLVIATGLMSQAITRFFPEPIIEKPVAKPVAATTAAVDPKVVQVIQAAIDQHRQRG